MNNNLFYFQLSLKYRAHHDMTALIAGGTTDNQKTTFIKYQLNQAD